ncbi:MAG: tetratricopeptide repeat protein [Candidatus Altiarchaeota archaeon]
MDKILEDKNFDEALKSAKIEDVNFLIEKGVSLLESDDSDSVEKAEKIFRRILELDNKNFIAHNNLGVILFNKGKFTDAESEYRSAIEFATQNSDKAYEEGSNLERRGDFNNAIRFYEDAIETSLKIADFHYNLGILLHSEKKYKEASQCYKQSIQSYVDYAEALAKSKIFDNTQKIEKKFSDLNLRLADTHYNSALLSHEQKAYKDAETEYMKTISIVINAVEELTKRKISLQDIESKESIDIEKKILKYKARLIDAHYNLGILLHEQSIFDRAENEYKKVIELNPRHEDAYYNLGVLYQQQKKYEEAKIQYKLVLHINPGNLLAKINLETIEKKEKIKM